MTSVHPGLETYLAEPWPQLSGRCRTILPREGVGDQIALVAGIVQVHLDVALVQPRAAGAAAVGGVAGDRDVATQPLARPRGGDPADDVAVDLAGRRCPAGGSAGAKGISYEHAGKPSVKAESLTEDGASLGRTRAVSGHGGHAHTAPPTDGCVPSMVPPRGPVKL